MFTMSNKNDLYGMSDSAIVRLIGKEIKRIRLENNITQEQLSQRSGVGRSFLSQVENGRPASILTIIQILRALHRLDLFGEFQSEPTMSPMVLARMEKGKRLRATHKSSRTNKKQSTW